ncbi:MAG: Acetyltransferase family [Paenibacillus sp.]|jgi:ribosomal protein S18 acetylase RimI-like enzyme|nr:Acetyltransferase family [Paenibacillus sp.]
MIRTADVNDLDFLIQIDLQDEGITFPPNANKSEEELQRHRDKMRTFVTDPDRGAFIVEDTDSEGRIGLIMYLIANRDTVYPWKTIFHELKREWFQEDGRFVEIFQLWVHPEFRRRGIATKLKRKLEEEAIRCGMNVIYTHTEERNDHVVTLNQKLGYVEVRRGPIWDEVVRISLLKHLQL